MKFARSSNLVTRQVAGETIVVPLHGGVADLTAVFVLDEVGADIWTLLEQARPVQEIVDTLKTTYDADAQVLRQDVTEFLETLRGAGLIRELAGEAA